LYCLDVLCTDDVFTFYRIVELFLLLLYYLDFCIVSGQLALLHQ